MKKERIDEITLLRAFAFFAITLQHCIAEYIYRPDIAPPDAIMLAMWFHFTRFGTPAFVFMAGALLFYNYDASMKYGTFLKKRFGDIFVPFLTWTGVYWVAVTIYAGGSFAEAATWIELGRQLVTPTYGYHLWFILMIFQFYLLFPLLYRMGSAWARWLGQSERRARVAPGALLAALGLAYLGLMQFSYASAGASGAALGGVWEWLMTHRSKWFVFYFFYFALGAACAIGLQRFRRVAVQSIAPCILAFVCMYVWAGYELLQTSTEQMKLGASTYLRPLIVPLIVSQLMALYGLAVVFDRHGGRWRSWLLSIGRLSFGGFLAHPFVLMLVAALTRPMPLEGYHLPVAAATFVLVAAGALAIAKAATLLPFGWLLVGAQGRARTRSAAEMPGEAGRGASGRLGT